MTTYNIEMTYQTGETFLITAGHAHQLKRYYTLDEAYTAANSMRRNKHNAHLTFRIIEAQ
jgi:hypothetical protein